MVQRSDHSDRYWKKGVTMRSFCFGLSVLALLAPINLAHADGFDGTYVMSGPATCPFRLMLTAAGSTVMGQVQAARTYPVTTVPIAPDGSFTNHFDQPIPTTISGVFDKDGGVRVDIQSSACGKISVSGKRS
jgi:hypothetical protein